MASGSVKSVSVCSSPKSSSSSDQDIEEWDTEDVVFWLEANGLHLYTQGFKDQKIDGLCLKEGLSENELSSCQVRTVGEKRLLQRKISELVGHSKPKVPKLTKSKALSSNSLSPQQKDNLLRRKKQVHRKTVLIFPGNKVPIIRGNPDAKRKLEELVKECRDLINPDFGYDEEELRRHIRTILNEQRRMVREGYNYEEKSSDEDKSSLNDQEKETGSEHEQSSSELDDHDDPDDPHDQEDQEESGLPGGADSVPLSTAETIILVYFNKGYTKEVKKQGHLEPLCRELKLKKFKSKDKNELIMLLAKELIIKQRVILKKDADFYCLHRESIKVA